MKHIIVLSKTILMCFNCIFTFIQTFMAQHSIAIWRWQWYGCLAPDSSSAVRE